MSIIVRNNSNSNSSGSGGGGGDNGYPPDSVNIIRSSAYNKTVVLQWSDPQDTILDAIVFAKWSGTLLVKKEGEAPLNEKDGEVLLDNKIRDQYKDIQFIDENVEYDKTYYYRFFPYSEEGVYSTDLKNVTPGIIPKEVHETFGDNTFDQIHYAIQQGIHDTLWSVGDTIKIYFNEITGLTVFDNYTLSETFSTPAGYIEFMIADFNRNTRYKDDTIINGDDDNNGNTLFWDIPYDYEENPKNIILVQKSYRDTDDFPIYFTRPYDSNGDNWLYPGQETYLDEFTRKCHLNLRDISQEKVNEYFCDIDFRAYYGWDTSLDELGRVGHYFIRQKFLRGWNRCFFRGSTLGNLGTNQFNIFTDNSSRIFKDENGSNPISYMLLETVWHSTSSSQCVSTSGIDNVEGFAYPDSGRIICALK